jgi:hypothetical protein
MTTMNERRDPPGEQDGPPSGQSGPSGRSGVVAWAVLAVLLLGVVLIRMLGGGC